MKKLIYIFLATITFSLLSCASKNKVIVSEEENKTAPEITDVKDFVEDDEVILIEDDQNLSNAEYLRSIDNLSEDELVSREEFEQDKAEILRIITELSEIMEKENYDEWVNYIDETSINYWTNKKNIQKAQLKLPNKTIKLNNLKDYFKYIFIPSRKRSKVDEIRYISKTNIKAVEVKEDSSIIVYYYFVKNNENKWLVQLPTL